jgi:hypothetical protein
MSGRRIDDHSFWGGSKGKDSVLPDGPHKVKTETSAEGSGHLGSIYPDTTEQIRAGQMAGDGKIKGRPVKPGYRY